MFVWFFSPLFLNQYLYSDVMDLPKGLRKYDYVGVGAIAVVLYISREIVVKYLRSIKSERFKHEVEFYRLLDS
jgi:hypothetical protein